MQKRMLFAGGSLPLPPAAQIQVFNAGIGGHNTRQGVNRIDNLLMQYKPTILVIGYGANDSVNSKALVPEQEFKDNLTRMITLARENGVRTIILNSCNPCIDSCLNARHKYSDDLQPSERIRRYNKFIAETAAAHKVIFNDFHAAVMQKGGASENAQSLIRNAANSKSNDGLHLTPDGARFLAETVADALDGIVRKDDRILCLGDSITYGASLVGAGTVTGQTYPAWLKTLLNFKLGLSREKTPPPYVEPPIQETDGRS
ncbi:MAG: hypothetical protein IJH79_17480 [Lentisphaeria bacterium]|nr:hypothetical protein [Lentisphaeria bacterium]